MKKKTTISCLGCGKQIIKRSYQHKFCSNKGRNNCKDSYWNRVEEKRYLRAQMRAEMKMTDVVWQ